MSKALRMFVSFLAETLLTSGAPASNRNRCALIARAIVDCAGCESRPVKTIRNRQFVTQYVILVSAIRTDQKSARVVIKRLLSLKI